MKKIRSIISKIKSRFSNFIGKTFCDKRKTFKFLAIFVFTVLFFLEVSMILINNSFYNNASDDVLQYYTIIVDFISSLKDGSISWFNLNNYYGASFFSDIYYIPIDIFTGVTFLLSYAMPIEVAYSVTELFKIFVGVMLFAYYLSLQNMKNRTIFWMGIIYFIGGGTVSFMAFPVFLTLTVYMPLALIVIHYFFHKKRWIVPLFALATIFYDFYLGYTILAFSCFAFILEYMKQPNFKFLHFVRDTFIFVSLLLLGVLMSAVIAYPAILYIFEETYRGTSSFNAWIINIFGYELKLFQPDIYVRVFAKMFVEQRPIGFYGFENSYATEHFSLYISIIGFVYMNYIFFMKDRISKIYKVAIIVAILFIIFPLFSYVFSGTLDSPYTRWINMLPIFQIMILAHVFDQYGFEKVKMKWMTIIIGLLLVIGGGLIYYYNYQIGLDDYLASRDMLLADMILMCVSLGYLVILLVFGWLKKWTVVKWALWIEIIIAVGYAYSGPFSIRNKIDTFENAHQIDVFLDEMIDNDGFYRVYVDIDNLSVEDTNFNRMTGYMTNTGIFHSWTDSETNDISYLLYNAREYQSKNKMNNFGYYVNHFLGYQYVLVNAENNYALDPQYFSIIAANQQYVLYEINYASPFRVFEGYLTFDDFKTFNNRNSDMATEKVLLMAAVIDMERYAQESFNLELVASENEPNNLLIKSYTTVSTGINIVTEGFEDESQRLFYQYTQEDLGIDFDMGAVYIRGVGFDAEHFDEVYMEFEDGSKKVCWIQPEEAHDIKCEFFSRPTSIYIEDSDEMYQAPVLQVRPEAAISGAAYMVFDLSNIDLDTDSGVLSFAVNTNFNLERSFVIDELGNQHECIDGFYSFESKPDKLYAFKTAKMYDYSNLFNLALRYSYDDIADASDLLVQDHAEEKFLSIERGKISLRYTRTSDTTYDQIIVVPVVYSDDWVFTDGSTYETISASGGFLGIIIPQGVTYINITMKFVPKGLSLGALGTLGGIVVYLGIFLPAWVKKRKNGDDSE